MYEEERQTSLPIAIRLIVLIAILLTFLGGAVWQPRDEKARVQSYVRAVEFDFTEWTLQALFDKAVSAALRPEKLLDSAVSKQVVKDYLSQVGLVVHLEQELTRASSNPLQHDPAVTDQAKQLSDAARADLHRLAKLAEPVLQLQTETTLNALGFGLGGQILPPVLYHVTDLPMNLIVSPRTEIRTMMEVSLAPGLDSVERELIEEGVFTGESLSALVEPVGGLGAYPTMVMRTSDIVWLTETIAHEWIHNWLTFRPLGVRYFASPEMKTINETTASIAGKEIGIELLRRYYPDRVPEETSPVVQEPETVEPMLEEVFVYRKEMRVTRVRAEELLAQGKVEEAEAYMEQRRQVFWQEGYPLRKLNQAYFAFYGSYNDVPGGGAAGEDPVGPAVQRVRAESPTLKRFIAVVSRVRSYAELQGLAAASN